MNKIPSVFLRNPENMNELLKTPHPDALWVLAGEGSATRKYDGTCIMLDHEYHWWARREVKPGKAAPPGWIPVGKDDITGKAMGWEPIAQSSFWNSFAEFDYQGEDLQPGTYELCGPKINGNPENLKKPKIFKHSDAETIPFGSKLRFQKHLLDTGQDGQYTFDDLKYLVMLVHNDFGWEGIVWHHPDGRMAKLKGRDFK